MVKVGDKVHAYTALGKCCQGEVMAVYPGLDQAIVKIDGESYKIPIGSLARVEEPVEKDEPITREEFSDALNIVLAVFAERITDQIFGGANG